MYWGSNIYVNIMPSWNWWRPRPYVVIYDSWGWNNYGWNNYNCYNPWHRYGGNYYGWNNGYYNGYYNGYQNGYYNGYNDGMYGNWYGGMYGKTYDASGPRFQQTSANSGSNSLPGKYGKTDENTPREGVLKPGTTSGHSPATSAQPKPPVNNTVAKPIETPQVPRDGWKNTPAVTETPNRNNTPGTMETSPRPKPDNIQPESSPRWNNIERNNGNRDRLNNRWNNVQREQPNSVIPSEQPSRVAPDTRDRMERNFEPVQRPQRNFEPRQIEPQRNVEPQHVQPQRNFEPRQMEQRSFERFDNGNRQMQPQRMERSEPIQQRNFGGGMRRHP